MRRLAFMTVGLIVILNIAPSVLPLEGLLIGLAGYVGVLVWWVWPPRRVEKGAGRPCQKPNGSDMNDPRRDFGEK